MGRRPREVYATPLDIELLAALDATGSIVDACARLSLGRDLGMYRLRRLARALGAPAVTSRRGGSTRGGTVLTELGRRVLRQGPGPLSRVPGREPVDLRPANVFDGVWHGHPQAHVTLEDGTNLYVGFAAREGETVRIGIEPEAIVVARGRFRSSARNVLRGTVESIHRSDALRVLLRVRVGQGTRLTTAITPASQAQLRVSPDARVFLYLKATAVRRLP